MYEDTPLLVVEDADTLERVVERLSKAPVIAVDTEADSMYHYQEKCCLIQISDAEGDIIIDPLAVSDMSPLGELFDDPGICKVLHGADYDVVSLRRDFNLHFRNLFDTLIAAQFLTMPRIGYADLVKAHFGVELDKQFQRHDWSRRPLQPEHLDYARGDTHYLLALREMLLHKLRRAGRLMHHAEECAILEQREWSSKADDPDAWMRVKNTGHLDDPGKRVLRALWHYRDDQARKLDRPPFKVLSDRILAQLATERPSGRAGLDRALPGMHGLKRRHADSLVRILADAEADTSPLPKPAKADKPPPPPYEVRLSGRAADKVMEALKTWRNKTAKKRGNSPYTVASNGILKTIAHALPQDLDELGQLPDVRAWQVSDHGEAILAVIDANAPKPKKKKK